MATKIRSKFPEEVQAIRDIRDINSGLGAYALATAIWRNTFSPGTDSYKKAGRVDSRSRLSVLSVIRRYDASKAKQNNVAA